jgi:hypothetical protein
MKLVKIELLASFGVCHLTTLVAKQRSFFFFFFLPQHSFSGGEKMLMDY